jgi:hypothetical protein
MRRRKNEHYLSREDDAHRDAAIHTVTSHTRRIEVNAIPTTEISTIPTTVVVNAVRTTVEKATLRTVEEAVATQV